MNTPDNKDQSASQLSGELHQIAQLMAYDFDSSIYRKEGLSWASYRVLFALWTSGDLSPLQLADATGMKKSAVSNLIKPLMQRELIGHTVAAGDRRSKILSLSDSGRELVQSLTLEQNAVDAQWFGELTTIEQDLLSSLFQKLLASPRASQVRASRAN